MVNSSYKTLQHPIFSLFPLPTDQNICVFPFSFVPRFHDHILRPVPLRYHFATNAGVRPLFKDKDAGPGALKAANTFAGRNLQGRGRTKRGGQKR